MMHQIVRVGSGSQIRGVRAGTTQPPAPSEDWIFRSDVPEAASPPGTLWNVEYQSDFTGPANDPPPAPWHTGTEWAGSHAQLGGHVWRDQVNLDSHAYIDGSGNLVLKLDWDATYSVVKGGYLITDQDGSIVRDGDYRVDPTAEDGVLIEIEATLPADQPSASWCAGWTFATIDATPLHASLTGQDSLREEIDLFEHIGNAPPYYEETFLTNTHGRQPGLLSDCAADEGHAAGEGFRPDTMWGGDPPNDGNPHTWSLMWVPDPGGAQSFFYDGHEYATRPHGSDTVHSWPHGLRLSWETQYPSNPFGAGASDPATETAKFPRYMIVHSVRVLRRRLPAPAPPSPGKPTAAAVLDAKGYSLAWQDRLGETDAPTDDRQFFGAYTGARVSEDPPDGYPNENNRRLSFVTFDGKPCLKSIYRAGEHGWLNFRSMVLPQRYRKIGLAVDVFVPTAFELLNSSGATISGKTMFGLVIGHPDHQRPGVLPGWAPNVPSRAWRGAVCVPEDQLGAECGINWTYRNTTGAFEFDIYAHVPGRRANGVYYPRMDAFSNIYAISGVAASPKVPVPRGRWFTLTWLAEIDTNAGDGVLEMWYDNVLVASVTGIDLGGWVGDRGLYKGRTKTAAPSGMADTDTNRQQYSFGFGDLSNTSLGQYAWNKGGWRGQGIFIRDMIGGVTSDPAKVPRTTSAYYAYNWRVKGVV